MCTYYYQIMQCWLCNPDVGTGDETTLCQGFFEDFYDACKYDRYSKFEYAEETVDVVHYYPDAIAGSRAQEFAKDPKEFYEKVLQWRMQEYVPDYAVTGPDVGGLPWDTIPTDHCWSGVSSLSLNAILMTFILLVSMLLLSR